MKLVKRGIRTEASNPTGTAVLFGEVNHLLRIRIPINDRAAANKIKDYSDTETGTTLKES